MNNWKKYWIKAAAFFLLRVPCPASWRRRTVRSYLLDQNSRGLCPRDFIFRVLVRKPRCATQRRRVGGETVT